MDNAPRPPLRKLYDMTFQDMRSQLPKGDGGINLENVCDHLDGLLKGITDLYLLEFQVAELTFEYAFLHDYPSKEIADFYDSLRWRQFPISAKNGVPWMAQGKWTWMRERRANHKERDAKLRMDYEREEAERANSDNKRRAKISTTQNKRYAKERKQMAETFVHGDFT